MYDTCKHVMTRLSMLLCTKNYVDIMKAFELTTDSCNVSLSYPSRMLARGLIHTFAAPTSSPKSTRATKLHEPKNQTEPSKPDTVGAAIPLSLRDLEWPRSDDMFINKIRQSWPFATLHVYDKREAVVRSPSSSSSFLRTDHLAIPGGQSDSLCPST